MRFSTLRTYDIPRYWTDPKTGKDVGFAPAVWEAMTKIVGLPPDAGVITVIPKSKAETLIILELNRTTFKKYLRSK